MAGEDRREQLQLCEAFRAQKADGPGDIRQAALARFNEEIKPLRDREVATVRARENSQAAALAEAIRDQLVQAAYVELAVAAADGLFAAEGGAGFTVATV